MNFSKLTQLLDSLGERHIPARDLMVTIGGDVVYRHFAGTRDEAGAAPMDGREAYWVYSMTKPLTIACALKLMEEGALGLSDAVCRYLPEYSKYPTMTIEHLMSMRAGLDYDLQASAILALGRNASTRQAVAAMAEKPLHFPPGTDYLYGLCHDVLAGVIEVASGMKFGEYMKKALFDPLGMAHSGFKVEDYHRENLCAQYELDASQTRLMPLDRFYNNFRLTDAYESGGAGLITTVEDFMRFASAMASGGGGILSMETIDVWRGRTLTGKAKETFDQMGRAGYNYALGVRVLVDGRYSKGPVGEFGWDGAAGAHVIMDPKNQLAAVYAQHVRNMGYVYSEIHPKLRDLIYEGIAN